MVLKIDYEPEYKSEGYIVDKTIRDVFHFRTLLRENSHPELLNYDPEIGIYRANFNNSLRDTVFLTGNQLASVRSKSAEEYVYGTIYNKTRVTILSLARLRSLKGEDTAN